MDARVIVIAVMQKFGEKSIDIGWFIAILEGGHILPPRTQATSRCPAPLGLKDFVENDFSGFGSEVLKGIFHPISYILTLIKLKSVCYFFEYDRLSLI